MGLNDSHDDAASCSEPYKDNILEDLMTVKNDEDGMTILEQSFFLLFAEGEEQFVIYLLNEIPNIQSFLYQVDDRGWLPLFRVLHLF